MLICMHAGVEGVGNGPRAHLMPSGSTGASDHKHLTSPELVAAADLKVLQAGRRIVRRERQQRARRGLHVGGLRAEGGRDAQRLPCAQLGGRGEGGGSVKGVRGVGLREGGQRGGEAPG